MLQGAPELTPGQLLDAGRRAEAEGKVDLAVQFYLHLAEHFGQTPDAAEARSAIIRMAAAGRPRQVWQASTVTESRVPRYRSGRALAAFCSAIGWVAIIGALSTAATSVGLYYAQVPVVAQLEPGMEFLTRLAIAACAGALLVIAGQVARALFEQANATRELLAIERVRTGADQG